MGTLNELLEDDRFIALEHKDKMEVLGRFYDQKAQTGEADEYDRIQGLSAFDLRHSYASETESRKPFIKARFDALTQFANETAGADRLTKQLALQRYVRKQDLLDKSEQRESEKLREGMELARDIFVGDPDQVMRTFKEEGIEGKAQTMLGMIAEDAVGLIKSGSKAVLGGAVSMDELTPQDLREKKAIQSKARMKELGFSDKQIATMVNDIWDEHRSRKDGKDSPFRVDSRGEIAMNTESLIRMTPDELAEKIEGTDATRAAKDRALRILPAAQEQAVLAWTKNTEMPGLKEGETKGGQMERFTSKIDEFLSKEENRGEFEKFIKGSGVKLESSVYSLLGGTAGILRIRPLAEKFNEWTDIAEQDAQNLKAGAVAGFSSDVIQLIPDILLARGGGSAARNLARMGWAKRGAEAMSSMRFLKNQSFLKAVKFEQAMTRVGVAAASGYGAGARTVNDALAQGLDYMDAVGLGLQQMLITGLITHLGSKTGVERLATGEAFKAEGRRFFRDFIGKDLFGEGVEEMTDELLSGVLVERQLNPDMSAREIGEAGLKAFWLGIAAGGIAGGIEKVNTGISKMVAPSTAAALEAEIKPIEVTEGFADPSAMPAPGEVSNDTEIPDASTQVPDGAAPEIVPEPEVRTEPDKKGELPPSEEAPEPKKPAKVLDRIDLGGGVVVEEVDGGSSIEEQIFGDAAKKQPVTGSIDRRTIQIREENGQQRVWAEGARTDKVFNPKTGSFETDKTGKIGFHSSSLFGKKKAASTSNPGTPSKPSKPNASQGSSARVAFVNAGNPDPKVRDSRQKMLSENKTAEDLDALVGEDGEIDFVPGVEGGGRYNAETGRIEMDPDQKSGATLRQTVMPKISIERSAANTTSLIGETAATLGVEESEARAEIARAVNGDKAAAGRIRDAIKNGGEKVGQEVAAVLQSIEGNASGPNVSNAVSEKVDSFRNATEKETSVKLGSGIVDGGAVPTARRGIFRLTREQFSRVRRDTKGKGANKNKTAIHSGKADQAAVMRETLPVGSIIQVPNPTRGDQAGAESWIVKSVTRMMDGTIRHDLEMLPDTTEGIRSRLDSLYADPAAREELVQFLRDLKADGLDASRDAFRSFITKALSDITSSEFASTKLRFAKADEGDGKSTNPVYVRVAETSIVPFNEGPPILEAEIVVNEEVMLRLLARYAMVLRGKSDTAAQTGVDDVAMFIQTMLFEEVAHVHALETLDQREIAKAVKEWIVIAKTDAGARQQLVDWLRYADSAYGEDAKSDEDLWKDIEAAWDGREDSPQATELVDGMAYRIGHEAMAGFVQQLRGGFTTLQMQSIVSRWFGGFLNKPNSSAGKTDSSARKVTLTKRMGEMASRMVEAVRNFFSAHRRLRQLPPSIDKLVSDLESVLDDNKVKFPSFFDVRKNALVEGQNMIDQSLRAADGDFELFEAQRQLAASLETVRNKYLIPNAAIIRLEPGGPNLARLRVTDEVAELLSEEDLAAIRDSLQAINNSGRPGIILRNAADAYDIQFVLDRLGRKNAVGVTREERIEIISKAVEVAERSMKKALGLDRPGIDSGKIVDELRQFYQNEVHRVRREEIAKLGQRVPSVNFTDTKRYGKDAERFVAADAKVKSARGEFEARKENTPEKARAAEVLDDAIRERADLEYEARGFVRQTVSAPDAKGIIRQESRYVRAATPLSLSLLGQEIRRQHLARSENLRLRKAIEDRYPLTRFSNLTQLLNAVKAEMDSGQENGIFSRLFESGEFKSRFPNASSPAAALSAIDEAARLLKVTTSLQNVADEMDFALLGGRPPLRLRAGRNKTEITSWTNINLPSRRNRVASFGVPKMLRTPMTALTDFDETVATLAKSEEGSLGDRVARLSSLVRSEEQAGRRYGPEAVAARAELVSLQAQMAENGLKIQFVDGAGERFGIAFTQELPIEVQTELRGDNPQLITQLASSLSDSEAAAYSMVGFDRLAKVLNDDHSIPAKSVSKINARLVANQLVQQLGERVLQNDSRLDQSHMQHGGFPMELQEVEVSRDFDDNVVTDTVTVMPQEFLDLESYPESAIFDEWNPGRTMTALNESGYMGNLLLEVGAKLEMLEYESDAHSPATLFHDYGLTPAGFVYQLLAAPYTAFLARAKTATIEVTDEAGVVSRVGLPEYMARNARSEEQARRIIGMFENLAPGIESNAAFSSENNLESVMTNFTRLRWQAQAANAAFAETRYALTESQVMRDIGQEARQADQDRDTEFRLPIDIAYALNLSDQVRVFRDERERMMAEGLGEEDLIVSVMRPDRAYRHLATYTSLITESQNLVLREGENGVMVVQRELDNAQETRHAKEEEFSDELLTDAQQEAGFTLEGLEAQRRQDLDNRRAWWRTKVAMEMTGFDVSRALGLLNGREFIKSVARGDGGADVQYDFEKMDSFLLGELDRMAREEKANGIVLDVAPNPSGEFRASANTVDASIAELMSEFGRDQDGGLTPEGMALQAVLNSGGLVLPNYRPDETTFDDIEGIRPRHSASSWKVLTTLSSLIPGLRVVQGRFHHDNARGETPSLVFVASTQTPVLVAPYQYASMITGEDIHKAVRDMIGFMEQHGNVPIEEIAESLLQPLAEMTTFEGKERLYNHVRNTVLEFRENEAQKESLKKEQSIYKVKVGDETIRYELKPVLTTEEENAITGAVEAIWDRLINGIAFEVDRASGRSSTDSASLYMDPRQAQDHIDWLTPESAADVIATFLTNDSLKRVLAYSSVGREVGSDPDSYAWIGMGDLMKADLMVTLDDAFIPGFLNDMVADIAMDEENQRQPEEIVQGYREMFDRYLSGSRESEVEAGLDSEATTKPGTEKVLRHFVPSGIDAGTDTLVNAMSALRPEFETPPPGLSVKAPSGRMTEFEARQMIGFFGVEELAAIIQDESLIDRATSAVSVPELMRLSAEMAGIIRSRYKSVVRAKNVEGTSVAAAIYGHGTLGDGSYTDIRRKRMKEFEVNSGRYMAAERMGFARMNEDGSSMLDLYRLGENREEFVANLEAWLREAGLPVMIENPLAPSTAEGDERFINLVDRAWRQMEADRELRQRNLDRFQDDISMTIRRAEALELARTELAKARRQRIDGPTAGSFLNGIERTGLWNVLDGQNASRKALRGIVRAFYGDGEAMVDALARMIVDQDREAGRLGRFSMSDLVEQEGTDLFNRKVELLMQEVGSLERDHGVPPRDIERRMMLTVEELRKLRKRGDSAGEIKRLETALLAASRQVGEWTSRVTKKSDGLFGPGIVSRVEGLRSRKPVSFPLGRNQLARLESEVMTGLFGRKVDQFLSTVESITDPKAFVQTLQDHIIGQQLEALSELDVTPGDDVRLGDFQAALLDVTPAQEAVTRMVESGVDLDALIPDLEEQVRLARNTESPVSHIRGVLRGYLDRDMKMLFRSLDNSLRRDISRLPESVVGDGANAEGILEQMNLLRQRKPEFLTEAEYDDALLNAMQDALESRAMSTESHLMNLVQEQSRRQMRQRPWSNTLSRYRGVDLERARMAGTAEQIELTQRVLTDIALYRSKFQNDFLDKLNNLEGLARLEEASKLADDRLVADEQIRQAMERVTGRGYNISNSVLIPEDGRERIVSILERHGHIDPSEGSVEAAMEEMKLFASVGRLHDNADFTAPDPKETDEEYNQRTLAQAKRVFENFTRNGAATYGPLSDSRLGARWESMKKVGEEVFGYDLLKNYERAHESMYSWLLRFHEEMKAMPEDAMGTDADVMAQLAKLKSDVANFLELSGGLVDASMEIDKAVSPQVFSMLKPLYDEAKALMMARRWGDALEAGFINTNMISDSGWRLFNSLIHHDARIRSLFARNLEGQSIAQGITGILEFGPATTDASTGRTGYLAMTEAINVALAKAVPKRTSWKKKKNVKAGGKDARLDEKPDARAAAEGYFGQAIRSFLESGEPAERAAQLLQMFEVAETNAGVMDARRDLKNPLRQLKQYAVGLDPSLLEDSKIFSDLVKLFRPQLEKIIEPDYVPRGDEDPIFDVMSDPSRKYGEFLNNLFGYMQVAFQAQGQLIPKGEIPEDGEHSWSGGNRHLLNRQTVPFRWQRFFMSRRGIEDRPATLSDRVAMQGATWLKNPNVSFDSDILQMLDVNGLSAPSQILSDMAFRMNVAPALSLVQAFTGENESGSGSNFSLRYTKNRGILGNYYKGRSERSRFKTSSLESQSIEGRMHDIGLSMGKIVQDIVNADIHRSNPNTNLQDAIEFSGRVGMGVSLISLRQPLFQGLTPLFGYSFFRHGVKENLGIWKIAKDHTLSSIAKALRIKSDNPRFSDRMHAFVKQHSFSLYLRNAEGIELFRDTVLSATPHLEDQATMFFDDDHKLAKYERRYLNRVKSYAKAGIRGVDKSIKTMLGLTIASSEKVAVQSIFMTEIMKSLEMEVLKSSRTDLPELTIDNVLDNKFDDLLNFEILENARLVAVDLLAQSDTSKKGSMFQRQDNLPGELARGMVVTFASHMLSTSANSLAGSIMMRHGQQETQEVVVNKRDASGKLVRDAEGRIEREVQKQSRNFSAREGRRLIATNLMQNIAYQAMNYGFVSFALTQGIMAIANMAGLGWGEKEEEKITRWFYGLDEGKDARYGTFGRGARSFFAEFMMGSTRPFGYRMSRDQFEEGQMQKDWSKFGLRIGNEFTNQIPGLGLLSSTTAGGSVSSAAGQKLWETFSGIDMGTGSMAGMSFGPPGKDGQLSDSGFIRTVYLVTWFMRNYMANLSYPTIGMNHMAQPFFHETNAKKEDVTVGDRLKMIPPMMPMLPRESDYSGIKALSWENFDEAADVSIWHDEYAKSRKGKSSGSRRGTRK